MWEKISKVVIQNAIALVVIIGCLFISIMVMFVSIPNENIRMIDKFFDMCLVGVIGWLFTQSKNQKSL